MTITAEELKTLDKAATQGEFAASELHGATNIEVNDRLVAGTGGYQDWRDGTRSENEANGALIAALVNAYRSGLLVHVDDIDEQELLDEMSSERDEARGQADKLAREFMPKLAAVSLWISFSVDGPDGDKMMETLDDLCARLAALSQGEDE